MRQSANISQHAGVSEHLTLPVGTWTISKLVLEFLYSASISNLDSMRFQQESVVMETDEASSSNALPICAFLYK